MPPSKTARIIMQLWRTFFCSISPFKATFAQFEYSNAGPRYLDVSRSKFDFKIARCCGRVCVSRVSPLKMFTRESNYFASDNGNLIISIWGKLLVFNWIEIVCFEICFKVQFRGLNQFIFLLLYEYFCNLSSMKKLFLFMF